MTHSPFARGAGWQLAQVGEALVLTIAGQPPLRLGPGRWRATPWGRRLSATTLSTGEAMVMEVTYGTCTGSGEARGAPVTLRLGAGPAMRGCLLPTGERPYPGR